MAPRPWTARGPDGRLPADPRAHRRTMARSQPSPQSAAERRAAEAELRRLATALAPTHAPLVGAMRRQLRMRLPTAHEVVYEYADAFVVSFSPDERGQEGVLAIRAGADGVKLYFNRGKGLPDPDRLLRGSGRQTRWIDVEAASTLARPAVRCLIEAAIARGGVPFADTGRGPVVIRPGAASRRRRAN